MDDSLTVQLKNKSADPSIALTSANTATLKFTEIPLEWQLPSLLPNSARWSVDARAESASAEGLLSVHGLQSEMPDLHQLAGGDGAISPAAGRVHHHPHDLSTPRGGRVYSQGLLGEAKHVRVRIARVGCQIWRFGYFWWSSKVEPYNKFCLFPTTMFVFLHRTAETEIGSDQTQVHSVNEENMVPKYVVESNSYCSSEIHHKCF